ncbi:hypothetical protein BB559_001677 [Furculomyces boomerangus]|uniref:Transcription factor n=2 Tax=Harpellales TaxID=61421 RepID=A0A2T9Y017_9FUNG|nr:hypothetical protein BB559_006888 [Furculomyces boomerangus]PVU98306.1 hypothetical protein BB559_001677 [Furculomyces boomerangus]PVZ97516.1 hypothetical protein BB558_006520 [Smittium angustum]PVZ97920.1 hypothetical protein BB558_006101 [Smittium angustum]
MPQVLVLVGLPGCGKTMFSIKLTTIFKDWELINQDDIGSRSVCEATAAKLLKAGKNVVIDRCNFDEDQRKIWIKIAEEAYCPVDTLYFDINAKVCKERVKNRKGHPTGVEGKFGAEVVSRFDKILTAPKVHEGFRFVHSILPHLPSYNASIEEAYSEKTIKAIMALFPPNKEAKQNPCPPEKKEKAPEPKKESKEKIHVEVDIIEKGKKISSENVKVEVKEQSKSSGATKSEEKTCDFMTVPWADKGLTIVKPSEGFGTYKETKAMWEDEDHTKFFNHSLFNEQAEREEGKDRNLEKKTRHLQHSSHMVNAKAGMARAFDHMTLDRDQSGHEIAKSGKKQHFHDRSHYQHQHEHQEDAKSGQARTYEHKHMDNIRHIHSGDPDKARTEAFEHRSFNYAFKGNASFDPEKVIMSSFKNKIKFEDEIKASFHNLPMKDHFKFIQNVKWETELPTKPNFAVFK